MSELTLDQTRAIVDAALAHGRATECAPLAVVILDAGAHIKACLREDGATFLRVDVARAKAWGALGLGVSSRALGTMAAERPAFFAALSDIADGRLAPVPGGVLIRDADSAVIGAVGISGDISDKDEACVVAGIEAAGLKAQV